MSPWSLQLSDDYALVGLLMLVLFLCGVVLPWACSKAGKELKQ
jgi:hypothetical protein